MNLMTMNGASLGRGGLTSKIHVVVDGNGLPVQLGLTGGQAQDDRLCSVLLRQIPRHSWLLADRGYDADWIRAFVNERGAWANIPPKAIAKTRSPSALISTEGRAVLWVETPRAQLMRLQRSRFEVFLPQLLPSFVARIDVRFGSLADILKGPGHVRFTPNNGHSSLWRGASIAGLLPAEAHAHHRTMFDKVEVVPSETAILAKIDGERAIAEHRVEGSSEAMYVEAVGADHLPGEVAASAEAADIAFEHKLLVCSNLMPDTSSDERIDPFEVARAGDCGRRGTLY
jgi:transposase